MIQYDLRGAGYRFPLAAFALRVTNAVDATTSLVSTAAGPISTAANCGDLGSGLVAGTDVLELATGFSSVGPGTVASWSATGAGTFDIGLGGLGEPFVLTELSGHTVNDVLVGFGNGTAQCLARVTGTSVAGANTLSVQLVDRELQPTGNAMYPGCPATNMHLYRIEQRVRYLICRPLGATTPAQSGLYRQVSSTGTAAAPWDSLPALIQSGVEDLQVSVRYLDSTGVHGSGTGASCSTGPVPSCSCDDAVPPSCTLSPTDNAPTSITATSLIALSRGVRVQVTGVSARSTGTDAQFLRPASFDHPAGGGPVDHYFRSQTIFASSLENLGVTP